MFYIFHGDDPFSQKEALDDLLKTRIDDAGLLDLNTVYFEANVTLRELRQACQAAPFLAPIRVVVVQDYLKGKPDKNTLADLVAFVPELPETTRLVFLESTELGATHPLIKLARTNEDIGHEKSFRVASGAALVKWLQHRAVKKSGRIAPAAAQLLVESVASAPGMEEKRRKRELTHEPEILESELEKLLLYKSGSPDPTVQTEDVLLLSPYTAEASVFDFVDQLGNRNERRASALYHQKLSEGEDPFRLFAMVVRQFRLLIQAKELAEAGQRPPAMAKAMGVHGFVAGKLAQQSRNYSMAELERIYGHLLDIDMGVKTGEMDMQTALDLLVANLTLAP